jgi:hypothetical protein
MSLTQRTLNIEHNLHIRNCNYVKDLQYIYRRGQTIIYGLRYWTSNAELPRARCNENRNFQKCFTKATVLGVFFGINYATEDTGGQTGKKCGTKRKYGTFTKTFG